MATTTDDVELPEPGAKKTEFVGFRLDADTLAALDRMSPGNRSAFLRKLVKQADGHQPPPQERESAL